VLLIVINRNQWFQGDDWAPIADRWDLSDPQTLLAPHNEHWTTWTILVFRSLYALVGLRHYLPYMAVTVLLHLAIGHVLWRVAVRSGANRAVATAVTGVFLLSAAGAENLTWAFQMGFLGALWLGLEQVLLLDHSGRGWWRDGLAAFAGLAALPWSGIGPVMVGTGGLVAFVRRGPRRAALIVAPAALIALWWYRYFGRHAVHPGPVGTSPSSLVAYVVRGLTATLGQAAALPRLGGELLVLLAVVLMAGLLSRERRQWALAAALATGAVALFALTGFTRLATFGVESAATSRYLYIALALLLPAVTLALSVLARIPGAALLIAALAVVPMWSGIRVIDAQAQAQAVEEQRARRQIAAVAAMVGDRPSPLGNMPLTANLDETELIRIRGDGALPAVALGPLDRLAALVFLRITLTADPRLEFGSIPRPELARSHAAVLTPSAPGCVAIAAPVDGAWVELQFPRPASLRVAVAPAGALYPALVQGADLIERFRPLPVDGGQDRYLNVGIPNARVRLQGFAGVLTMLCGLASSQA
jgi:hypothetical protein